MERRHVRLTSASLAFDFPPGTTMLLRSRRAVVLASLALLSACFHTQVYTGLPGAGETISQPWARGFLFGMVPPSAVEPASKCKAGVYRVETQHTLANALALIATVGIYSPMRIDVTCVRVPMVSANPSLLVGSAHTGVLHPQLRVDGAAKRP